jgi:hypothetical protein
MTLSEAIRLGAMLKPQAFGDYTDGRGTCAWGAASEAAGRDVDDNDIPDEWFDLCDQPTAACPLCSQVFQRCCDRGLACACVDDVAPVAVAIVHLNDHHKASREFIADWVATIEAQQEQPTEQPQPVSVEV